MKEIKFSKVFLVLIMLLIYLPIAVVVVYSFNGSKISSVWSGLSLEWYRQLFDDVDMFVALKNSLVLATLSSVLSGIIGTLGAVGIRRSKMRAESSVEYLTMLPIMIPEIILGMLFMAFFSMLGMPFGMGTLVIAHSTFCIPYIYTVVKGRLSGIDRNVQEAARDLGAKEYQVILNIVLPQLMPAVISGMLLAFAMSLDDVIISIFVTGVNTNTLPIKIYSQLKTGVTPEINALCTLMLLVTIVILLLSAFLGKKHSEQN